MAPHGPLPSPLPAGYRPCSWCLAELDIEPDPNDSHSICDRHAAEMREQIAAREGDDNMDDQMKYAAGRAKQEQPGSFGPTAPKPWAECSFDEKLDRLHEEIVSTRWTRDQLVTLLHETLSQVRTLGAHRHGADGAVLVSFDTSPRVMGAGASVNRVFDPLV